MSLNEDLTKQLLIDEGEKLSAYQDSLGYWTIGVGHLIDARKGGRITPYISRLLLRDDIHENLAGIIRVLPWVHRLDDARLGVLINLSFNMGVSELLWFKHMLASLQEGNWDMVADELLNSRYALQVGNRAVRLAKQLRTGVWQYG